MEKRAKAAHDIWAHWMKYFFTLCHEEIIDEKPTGSMIVPKEKVDRWIRLMNTGFEDLTDKEKASDYEVAEMFLRDGKL